MSTKDKYDEAIEFLLRDEEGELFASKVEMAWSYPEDEPGGALFTYCGEKDEDGLCCGCLTQVRQTDPRGRQMRAQTHALTEAIRSDARIPESVHDICPEHLPVFAEWQRRLDKELGR